MYVLIVVRLRFNIGEKDEVILFGFVFYDFGCECGWFVFVLLLFLINCFKLCGIEIILSVL